MEKDLLQIATFKDSVTGSSTAGAQAGSSQEVANLWNHKRALESSIREKMALLTENSKRRVQQVQEEVSCLQTELKDLSESFGILCEDSEVLPNISQLKQQWQTLQVRMGKMLLLPDNNIKSQRKNAHLSINLRILHTHMRDCIPKEAFVSPSGWRCQADAVVCKSE